MWRFRYALRRARLRLARLLARSPLARALRRAGPWLIVAALAAGAAWHAASRPERFEFFAARGEGAAEWLAAGWRYASGELSLRVDAESGRAMLQSVLPPLAGPAAGPEPAGSWRTPLRAWVYAATGYDFTSPRSFLESEVPGFRSAARRQMDVVHLPGGEVATGQPAGRQAETGGIEEGPVGARPGPPASLPGIPGLLEEVPPLLGGREEVPGEAPGAEEGPGRPGPVPGRTPLPAGRPAELAALAGRDWGREPLVLIFHSHTSESYRTNPPDPRATPLHHIYNSSDTGIVRVGRALAQKLQAEYGIPSIHSTRIHNWPHHARAYLSSRETVQEVLREHPSIKVVLDIHRQGVPDFTYATTVDGVDAVGIDIIYTTGLRASYPNPHWQENEAFALRLAAAMDEIHPGLLRRVMKVDDSVYNQDLHPRMLLLEVGNYLDFEEHAIAAAQLLADALASALHEILLEEEEATSAPALGRAVVPMGARPPVPLRRLDAAPGA